MSFVNEKYPETEKAIVEALVESRPKYSNPPGSSWWTVDRTRNAYLVLAGSEGGGYEDTVRVRHFVLSWDSNLIRLSVIRLGVSESKNGVVMSWKVVKLEIPPELEARQNEVISIIREAFSVMGDIYDGDKYAAVNVHFDLPAAR